jgi:hypothetical protein
MTRLAVNGVHIRQLVQGRATEFGITRPPLPRNAEEAQHDGFTDSGRDGMPVYAALFKIRICHAQSIAFESAVVPQFDGDSI